MRDEQEDEYLFEDAQHGILFGDRNVLKIIFVAQSYGSLVDLVQHQPCQRNPARDQHRGGNDGLFQVKGIHAVQDGIGGSSHHENQSILDETEFFAGFKNLSYFLDMVFG